MKIDHFTIKTDTDTNMEYEYKSILLTKGDNELSPSHSESLNQFFEEGWEYVDNVAQTVSGHYTYLGPIMIILKKKKEIKL